jgi:DNA-binding NarL/FixJ family response regulator
VRSGYVGSELPRGSRAAGTGPLRQDTIDVVVVDDQVAVRERLPALLSGDDIVVRATAPASAKAVSLVQRLRPAVVVVGLGPDDARGFELVRKLATARNGMSVLLHVRDTTAPAQIARARRYGAAGAVSTRSPKEDLKAAVRAVAAGEVWFHVDDGPQLLRSAGLSDRERHVLAAIAAGHSLEKIGDALHLSPHTVRTHLRNVMRKLGAQTRAHAVAIALTEGAIVLTEGSIEVDP